MDITITHRCHLIPVMTPLGWKMPLFCLQIMEGKSEILDTELYI